MHEKHHSENFNCTNSLQLQFAVSLTHTIIKNFTSDLYHEENYRRLEVALALKANNDIVIRLQSHFRLESYAVRVSEW
jgi:hypothetical protein